MEMEREEKRDLEDTLKILANLKSFECELKRKLQELMTAIKEVGRN